MCVCVRARACVCKCECVCMCILIEYRLSLNYRPHAPQGYSLVGEVPSTSSSPLSLLTRCNLHSTMVLKALLKDG